MAELMYRNALQLPAVTKTKVTIRVGQGPGEQDMNSYPLSRRLFYAYANAIVDGNTLHDKQREKYGTAENLRYTVPDAIEACGSHLEEIDFHKEIGSMEKYLARHINVILKDPQLMPLKDLYLILIAYERAVLFVVNRIHRTVALFDSHSHNDKGALIAVSSVGNLKWLCEWICENIFVESNDHCVLSSGESYELSVLHFVGKLDIDDCARTRPIILREIQLFPKPCNYTTSANPLKKTNKKQKPEYIKWDL